MSDTGPQFAELMKAFQKHNNYARHMGKSFEVVGPGQAIYRLKVEEKHLSSPQVCHGGAIASLMDSTLGLTVLSYAFTKQEICSTVEFKLNFLSPAYLGDTLKGVGKLDYIGKRLVVANAEIYAEERGVLVAKGLGTFNLYPATKKEFLKEYLSDDKKPTN